MEKENNLIEIIETNKLSIKNNPFGTKRLWPYSYIELFYNSFCNKLYKINPSAWILEVNQEKIDEFVENEAEKYKDPDQFKTWINSQPKQLDNYKMIILEEQLIEKLKNELKSKVKLNVTGASKAAIDAVAKAGGSLTIASSAE